MIVSVAQHSITPCEVFAIKYAEADALPPARSESV